MPALFFQHLSNLPNTDNMPAGAHSSSGRTASRGGMKPENLHCRQHLCAGSRGRVYGGPNFDGKPNR